MSVVAGRVFLGVTAAVLVVAVAWSAIAWQVSGPWPESGGPAFGLAFVAAVGLLVGVPAVGRFVEVRAEGDTLRLARVLRRTTQVRAQEVDEAVLMVVEFPGRYWSVDTPRVVLRRNGRTVTAFTPRVANVDGWLDAHGIRTVRVAETLTPRQASRLYAGSVSRYEVLLGAMPVVSIGLMVFALVVLAWLLWWR